LLIAAYGKCGRIEESFSVFQQMHFRNALTWSTMIAAYSQNNSPRKALDLFHQMQVSGFQPTLNSFASLIQACASLKDLKQGHEVMAYMIQCGLKPDLAVQNVLINMYATCGKLEDAVALFNGLQQRNVITWTAMIEGYIQNGEKGPALAMFDAMQQNGVTPNVVTFSSVTKACTHPSELFIAKHLHTKFRELGLASNLQMDNSFIRMYAQCGSLEDAQSVFMSMPRRDTVSWNTMISAYADKKGYLKTVLSLFQKMKSEGCKPDEYIWASLFSACATNCSLEIAQQLYSEMLEGQQPLSNVLWNAVLNAFAKCGD
jgi:pentatricopeptide repeat protein